jgi:integrase
MNTRGIRRKGNRWEVSVRVKKKLRTTTFPLDTPDAIMAAWREAQRQQPVAAGSLAADVNAYLETVRHMPTYAERKFHLEWWVNRLGPDRSRYAITTQEIDAALSALRVEKSPTTARHYRSALLHLFNRLGGVAALNPVRASVRPHDPPPQPRAIPPATLKAILHAIKGPKTRARLWVMASTGLPHAQLMQLTPASVDWAHNRVRIPARKKGHGAAGRWLPLSRHARFAFRALDRAGAWGPFSSGAMRITWQRALKRLGLPMTWRPYDTRHTMGAQLYRATGDLATVARLLGHADQRTTVRYSLEAHEDTDAAAMAKVRMGRKTGRNIGLNPTPK